MCGIFGVWHRGGEPVDRDLVGSCTDRLAHRGPDDRGLHVDPDGGPGLGHRRLSILDTSEAGRQPMSRHGRYHITYNGEIYNFLELRRELEAAGEAFATGTDTEVVLAAYARWGEDCLLTFNGMWALAIWDRQERTLFLARDRFGIKPLFYLSQGERFAFASEMKAFTPLPWFTPRVDAGYAGRVLAEPLSEEAGPRCLLEGVSRLPAGYCLTLGPGGEPRLRRWWNTLDHLPDIPRRYRDQVALFRQTFLDAVGLRMRSDVPLGTALSGGLDSGSVLCAMHHAARRGGVDRLQDDWQKAFVAVYPDSAYDETAYAMKVVRHVGGRAVLQPVDRAAVLQDADRILYHLEDIYYDMPVGLWAVYGAMRREGVAVTLDGHGGDELLCGYHHHVVLAMGDALRGGHPARLASLYATLFLMYPTGMRPAMPSLHYVRHKPRLPEYHTRFPDFVEDEKRLGDRTSMERMLHFDTHVNSLPAILRNFDRMSMAHGVEIRTPFLDWRLATLAFALPPKARLGALRSKRILRSAMKGILPGSIRRRQTKIGFTHPKTDAHTPHMQYLRERVADRSFLDSGLFDGRGLARKMEPAFASGDWRGVPWPEPYVMASRLESLFCGG